MYRTNANKYKRRLQVTCFILAIEKVKKWHWLILMFFFILPIWFSNQHQAVATYSIPTVYFCCAVPLATMHRTVDSCLRTMSNHTLCRSIVLVCCERNTKTWCLPCLMQIVLSISYYGRDRMGLNETNPQYSRWPLDRTANTGKRNKNARHKTCVNAA